jgi:hypothetical protein
MSHILKWVVSAVALVALGLVAYQTIRVSRLQRRVNALARAQTAGRGAGGDKALAALRRRVAALERTATRLLGLLLSGRGGGPRADAGGWMKSELQGLRDDVDAVLTGEALDTEEGRKRLHELVKKAQKQSRERSRSERRKRWKKVFDFLVGEQLQKLAEDADLSQDQQDKLKKLINEEFERSRALRRAFRRGDKTAEEMITQSRKIRDEVDQKVKNMLSSSQYEKYQEQRRDFLGRRRRR